MRQVIILFLSLLTIQTNAQTTIIDDFDGSNQNTIWETVGTTFSISEVDGELQIDYSRDASSDLWDQFNVAFDNIELMKYDINLDVRSDVDFELSLKPVYTDNSNDWIQANISGNNTTTTITLSAEQTNIKTLNRIYIYFDGGSTVSKSGTVYIDNITIEKAAVFTRLNNAIEYADLLHLNSEEGSAAGQYASGSKSTYLSAINAAKSVATNTNASQSAINDALEALNNATYAFEIQANINSKVASLSFVDPNATIETKNLYYNLKEISAYHILFGMQDATGYGVGWTDDNDRSDVKDVCGAYPAVCAWSIKEVAKGSSYDDEVYRMSKIFNLGGLNSVEWHMDNPYGGDFYWENHPDPSKNVVVSIMPGGEHHDYYKTKLDNITYYLRNLKGDKGQSIPIIFRPFHELNGSWFWWGQPHCTPQEYKDLWIFTVDYLKSKKVNNLLYAYSPDRFVTESNYLECYPGDDYVDILGFDDYSDLKYNEGLNLDDFVNQLGILTDLAEDKNKVAALTETGYEGVKYSKWFTEVLLDPIKNDAKAKKIAYAAVWRNANDTHHYAPYPGHASASDFAGFYNDNVTIFIDNIPEMYGEVLNMNAPLAINTVIDNISTRVYPNPASNSIIIESEKPLKSLELYQMNGAKILDLTNIETNYSEINLRAIQKGTYVLKITAKDCRPITKKVVISR